jgi:acylphosphatase
LALPDRRREGYSPRSSAGYNVLNEQIQGSGVKRLEAVVHGYVHGVSFRYYTLREAAMRSLTGWVANRPDGTVCVVAEGSEADLRAFRAFLSHGSPAADVSHVEESWLEASGEFPGFTVRHL